MVSLPPLTNSSWMQADETKLVMAALSIDGQDVRFVGGCVRDALAGRPVKDIDIATPDRPERVIQLLEQAGIKALPTGMEHGTITAVCNHKPFEITTLRVDVETYGRHAKVAFTDCWVQDAARRDLTINALSCSPDGTLHDPFGGVEDLLAGRVRFVGEARQRIEEDALRLLRFFRFHAYYGQGALDPEGLAAAREKAGMLKKLSAERIREEFLRLLKAPDPRTVLAAMLEGEILKPFLPEAKELATLEALLGLSATSDPLLRLAALVAGGASRSVAKIPDRLRFSNAEKDRFLTLCKPPLPVEPASSKEERDQALYRLGDETVADLLLLAQAKRIAGGEVAVGQQDAVYEHAMAQVRAWNAVTFPLKGRDLIAAGFEAGPGLGEILRRVEDWWIAQEFTPGKEACLSYALSLKA